MSNDFLRVYTLNLIKLKVILTLSNIQKSPSKKGKILKF